MYTGRMTVQEKYKYDVNILWWVYIKTFFGYELYNGVYEGATSAIASIDFW